MAFIPMTNEGGGIKHTSFQLDIPYDSPLSPGIQQTINITPPETGYIPVGWSLSNITVGSGVACTNVFISEHSGTWRFTVRNVGDVDSYMQGTINILWIKP